VTTNSDDERRSAELELARCEAVLEAAERAFVALDDVPSAIEKLRQLRCTIDERLALVDEIRAAPVLSELERGKLYPTAAERYVDTLAASFEHYEECVRAERTGMPMPRFDSEAARMRVAETRFD
jgi:hypothetical protein